MKRVLLTTHPTAYLKQGGGEREIHLLKRAFDAADILVDIYGPNSLPIDQYDIVIHFSMVSGSELVLRESAAAGKKMILWPNLWLVSPPTEGHLKYLQALIEIFDAFVFKSKTEEAHFKSLFRIDEKYSINVLPLVTKSFSRKNITPVFKESYGLDRYVIWPGIIEPQKNQLSAIRAFREIEIPLVISGQVRDSDYYEACKREATENVVFIPEMPFASELHLSALAHSELFLELPLDFPGTSALEAAALDCKMLLSKSTWVDELIPGASQVEPTNIESIIESVNKLASSRITPDSRAPKYQTSEVDAVRGLIEYIKAF